MKELNTVLTELGISKVRLSKYLGVSRQMLYNYLSLDTIEEWPKEKAAKVLALLDIKEEKDLKNIKVSGEYIVEVENRLKSNTINSKEEINTTIDFGNLNKKEQELLNNIVKLLTEKLTEDKTKVEIDTKLIES